MLHTLEVKNKIIKTKYWIEFKFCGKLGYIGRSSHRRCSVRKNVLRNFAKNTCARVSFLIKLQAKPATLLKKRLWHRCFSANYAKFLKTPFLQNTSGRLLLKITSLDLTSKFLNLKIHCVKSVQIRSYSGQHFPAFGLNMERYSVWRDNPSVFL